MWTVRLFADLVIHIYLKKNKLVGNPRIIDYRDTPLVIFCNPFSKQQVCYVTKFMLSTFLLCLIYCLSKFVRGLYVQALFYILLINPICKLSWSLAWTAFYCILGSAFYKRNNTNVPRWKHSQNQLSYPRQDFLNITHKITTNTVSCYGIF